MSLFVPLEGSVVLRSQGEYQAATLAECEGAVFAKLAGKYFRLKKDGSTSVPRFYWGPLDLKAKMTFEASSGNMVLVKIGKAA